MCSISFNPMKPGGQDLKLSAKKASTEARRLALFRLHDLSPLAAQEEDFAHADRYTKSSHRDVRDEPKLREKRIRDNPVQLLA
jgi:hypothetical protein